ncbi:MAG TPA: hypothetical protein VGO62_20060 [Myxococcota bacterium]|jgi:hypothetical protein
MERARDGAGIATIHAAGARRCVRCGDVIAGPFWIIAFPDAAHEACVDWRGRAFPFERELAVLRFLVRRVPDRMPLLRIVNELVSLKRRWQQDALAVLVDGRVLIERARPLLSTLDHRDRQRL